MPVLLPMVRHLDWSNATRPRMGQKGPTAAIRLVHNHPIIYIILVQLARLAGRFSAGKLAGPIPMDTQEPKERTIRIVCFDVGGVLVRLRKSWTDVCRAAGFEIRGEAAGDR